nr:MAG TPA: hypothetical protein [Crassvirales sp.]
MNLLPYRKLGCSIQSELYLLRLPNPLDFYYTQHIKVGANYILLYNSSTKGSKGISAVR